MKHPKTLKEISTRRKFLKRAAALSVGLAAAGPLATQGMAATQKPAGLVPVGGVIAWLKSFTNVPTLPDEYVELNGQVLSDAQSVFNGQTLPDLSGTTGSHIKRFIRFSTTSGTTGGADNAFITDTQTSPMGLTSAQINYGQNITGGANTLPSYYEAVPIIRIK